jgi:hypothetical protein
LLSRLGGFQFKAGSIFDALKTFRWRPRSRELPCSTFTTTEFASDLSQGTFPYGYVFIEPKRGPKLRNGIAVAALEK